VELCQRAAGSDETATAAARTSSTRSCPSPTTDSSTTRSFCADQAGAKETCTEITQIALRYSDVDNDKKN
jgi:hypothetical protein